MTALYVRVGSKMVATLRASQGTLMTLEVHQDLLGSVRALTNDTGLLVSERAYEAFGKKDYESVPDSLVYGFSGEPLDVVTGLAYHRARWLDVRLGRFVSPDAWLGDETKPSSLHKYNYVSNSPVIHIDPSGHDGTTAEQMAIVSVIAILASSPFERSAGIVGYHGSGPAVSELSISATAKGILGHVFLSYNGPSGQDVVGAYPLADDGTDEIEYSHLTPLSGSSGKLENDQYHDSDVSHTFRLNMAQDSSYRAWRNSFGPYVNDSNMGKTNWNLCGSTCVTFAYDGLEHANVDPNFLRSRPLIPTGVVGEIGSYNQRYGNVTDGWIETR